MDSCPKSILEVDKIAVKVIKRKKASASTSNKDETKIVNQQNASVEDIEIEDDQSRSIDVDVEEEAKELSYCMTRQAIIMSRDTNPKKGVVVRGRSTKKPIGI